MKAIFLVLTAFLLSACAGLANRPEPFTVSLNSRQIELGEVNLRVRTIFGRLREETAAVIYFPMEDAVGLRFRQEATNFHQFWNRQGRAAFIEALARYNKDFEAQALDNTRPARTRQIYNVVDGFLIWQMARPLAPRADAPVRLGLGYVFVDRRPFFTVHQHRAEFRDRHTSDGTMETLPINLYFTRAQAAQLVEFFDQSLLNSLIRQTPDGAAAPAQDTDLDEWPLD